MAAPLGLGATSLTLHEGSRTSASSSCPLMPRATLTVSMGGCGGSAACCACCAAARGESTKEPEGPPRAGGAGAASAARWVCASSAWAWAWKGLGAGAPGGGGGGGLSRRQTAWCTSWMVQALGTSSTHLRRGTPATPVKALFGCGRKCSSGALGCVGGAAAWPSQRACASCQKVALQQRMAELLRLWLPVRSPQQQALPITKNTRAA